MKSKSLYIIILSVLALSSCQKNEMDAESAGDGTVKFYPSVAGAGIVTKAQSPSSETLDITFTSEDGTTSIPMTCETVEGIGNCNAEEVVTKGELINEFGPGPQPFDTDETFVVKAWDASTSDNIIPGTATGVYQTVTYSTSSSLWSTSENYYWNEGETKTFYAYSNLPSSGASIANTTAASQTLTYTVPSTASAQTDILMGCCTSDGKSGNPAEMTGTASILFSHPLTAVQFKLGTIEGLTSFAVNSITIKNVYASGTAEMTPTTAAQSDPKDRFTWTPSGTKTVSQTLSTQPSAAGNQIGEAFLLIPQAFNESSTACIAVNVTINGTKTVTLYHSLTSGEWKAGYTNTYTIGFNALPPGALPGIFSVSPTKKVYFSMGNLYWDGATSPGAYKFEANQNDYRKRYGQNALINGIETTTPENTVGGLFWDIEMYDYPYREEYQCSFPFREIDESEKDNYGFFPNETADTPKPNFTVNGVTGQYRALSSDEWEYLLNTRVVNGGTGIDKTYSLNISYGGSVGIVIYPDDYTDEVLSDTLTTLPEGVVFLPGSPAGGTCWTSVLYRLNGGVIGLDACFLYWNNSGWIDTDDCDEGASRQFFIRLVTDVE